MILAVCGKGGVGKTTVSAVAAKALGQHSWLRGLVIDGDPSGGLGMALEIKPESTLNDVREEVIRQIKEGQRNRRDVAASMEYLLADALMERGNLAFLSIGRPEDVGCYCRVNSFLKESIESLGVKFDVTLIDAEAGIEQINRDVMANVDYLLLVSDLSVKGLRVAETIEEVASDMIKGHGKGLVINRVRESDNRELVRSRTSLDIIGWIPEDDTIREFDEKERSFFELPDCPANEAIVKALQASGLF